MLIFGALLLVHSERYEDLIARAGMLDLRLDCRVIQPIRFEQVRHAGDGTVNVRVAKRRGQIELTEAPQFGGVGRSLDFSFVPDALNKDPWLNNEPHRDARSGSLRLYRNVVELAGG